MHHASVMLASEDVPGASHVRSQLINVLDTLNDAGDHSLVTQVTDNELIRYTLGEFGVLQVNASDPETFILQAPDQMTANEAASSANKYTLHKNLPDENLLTLKN